MTRPRKLVGSGRQEQTMWILSCQSSEKKRKERGGDVAVYVVGRSPFVAVLCVIELLLILSVSRVLGSSIWRMWSGKEIHDWDLEKNAIGGY